MTDGEVVCIEFVGGPKHGEQVVMPADRCGLAITVALPARISYSELVNGEISPLEPVQIETVDYVFLRRDVASGMHIYVPERDKPKSPEARSGPRGTWRWCRKCDVKWWGDPPCWFCGVETSPQFRP